MPHEAQILNARRVHPNNCSFAGGDLFSGELNNTSFLNFYTCSFTFWRLSALNLELSKVMRFRLCKDEHVVFSYALCKSVSIKA